jgi:hypothetical protein
VSTVGNSFQVVYDMRTLGLTGDLNFSENIVMGIEYILML